MRLNTPEHHDWLEKTSLVDIAKANLVHFEKIMRGCLNAKGEQVLIIGDKGHKDKRLATLMSIGYYLAAKKNGSKAEIILQESGDKKVEPRVVKALQGLKKDSIVIINLSGRLSGLGSLGKTYRRFARDMGHKFISATSLGLCNTSSYPTLINSINVDYAIMSRRGNKLKAILDDASDIRFVTKKGTNLHANIMGKKAIVNDGLFGEPGEGGNLPAGEVYIAPKGKSKISGKIVIDGSCSCKEGTILPKNPITIEVSNGSVVNIEGGEEARKLEKSLYITSKKSSLLFGTKRIGELGIGINNNARIIGVTIVDEKTLGTAHVGIGSNYWFGGTIYATTHFDQVFNDPLIYVDGKLLNVSNL